ncbi:hypothetical protein SARC_08100 [Sphaeroforma arctica JP610]|uniref:Uncharacterized protein n=1 Tax=Sphaeroforma arctica JP610 TaxID=667725 RepID=A0A0L0FSD5_9EUKA|nr:hypothetical protein SARC_08100 [Sphaeroforma arctica JP610]KNC79506.1 hypothetical protein SARC_08100 [Sphaeroforma arctica JP610]|eukprot:XP_014153408.1 hypothetical protein SARC_08100 [Sphaeroforma arctica JP610]
MVRHANTQRGGKRDGKHFTNANKNNKNVITTRTKVILNNRNKRTAGKIAKASTKSGANPSGDSVWNRIHLTPESIEQLGDTTKALALLNRSVSLAVTTKTTTTGGKNTGYSILAKEHQEVSRVGGDPSWIDPLMMDLAQAICISESFKGKANKPPMLERRVKELYGQARARKYTGIEDKVTMYKTLYLMRQQTKSREHEKCLSRLLHWEKMTVNEFFQYMEPEFMIARETVDYIRACHVADRDNYKRWEAIRRGAQ